MTPTNEFVPCRVLLAHSNDATREVIGGILHRRGHKVEEVGDVLGAIRVLGSGAIDVLLVSLHLPPSDYMAVLDGVAEPLRTIVIGEQGHVVAPEVAEDPRVSAVLVRPFSLQTLYDAVEASGSGAS
jgi:DNA-binding NtrC family response regulator